MISTSRLLSMIRSAKTFEQAVAYHETAPDPAFTTLLYQLMRDRNLSPKDMISRTGLERSYFYHVLSGMKKPGRNIVLRIGLALRTNLSEMNHLLQLSNASPLYAKIRRDAAIIYAIQHRMSMMETNELLVDAGEEPVYLYHE